MSEGQPPPPEQGILAGFRQKIDDVDRSLVELLNRRAELVVQVGKLKRQTGIPIYAPHREAAVLKKVLELNRGPLPDRTIEALYRELMSGSFHLEQPLRIGYLGPEGSYVHLAAIRHFGSSVKFEDLRAAEGAFTEVVRGHVDFAVVPIENATGSGIAETMHAFSLYHDSISIYAEIQLEVRRCLLTNSQPDQVRRIYSTQDALAHCRKWLAVQFPKVELITTDTTVNAVKQAKVEVEKGEDGVAAIGNDLAGEIYGLHALFENIEDKPDNLTRFLVLSQHNAAPSGNDKTSLMFTTLDRPGALVDVLAVFKRAGINLTHIDKVATNIFHRKASPRDQRQLADEPRASAEQINREYRFYIDAEGHRDDAGFAQVIGEARAHCKELTVLGSYPVSQRVL